MLSCFLPANICDILTDDGCSPPDEASFVITFDDGFKDNIEVVDTTLQEYGISAVFFPTFGSINQTYRQNGKEIRHMSWTDLKELTNLGHTIGSHFLTHTPLNKLTEEAVWFEYANSQQILTEQLGIAPRLVAYPFGIVPTRKIDLPKGSLAFGTVKSIATPWEKKPHEIRRVYLPSHLPEVWPELVRTWHAYWDTFDFQEF